MVATNIAYNQEELMAFCQKHHIRKLAFFGSVTREDFQPTSDIDVLVEFDSQHIPGLAFFGMETELSKIFGYPVDLNTPAFLSPYFRKRIESEALVAYEQT